MNQRLEQARKRWLQAESRGEDQAAETALRQAFQSLPGLSPSAGFAERVFAELAWSAAPAHVPLALHWKVAASVALVMAALASVPLSSLAASIWAALGSGELIDLGAAALVALGNRVAQTAVVWDATASLASAVSTGLRSSPSLIAYVGASILISVIALRSLHALLISERISQHVQSS